MLLCHTVKRVTFGSPVIHATGISPISCVSCKYSSLNVLASWLAVVVLPQLAGREPVMLVRFRSTTLSCSADQAVWQTHAEWLLQACVMQQQPRLSQQQRQYHVLGPLCS